MMNAKRFYYVMLGFLGLLVISCGGALAYADGYLKKQSEKVSALKVEQAVLEAQEASYIKSRNELKKYEDLQASIEKILPKDKDQARAVSELFTIAAESDMRISTVTFPSSDLGRQIKPATPAPAADAGGSSTAPTATPAPVPPATPSITQAKPVEGMPGVLGIPITLEVDPLSIDRPITYERFLAFMRKLEVNRRTMQVSQVTLTPVKKQLGGEFDFSLNLTIFVKP